MLSLFYVSNISPGLMFFCCNLNTDVVVVVVVVVCFHDLKFCLRSQLNAASCARCSSEKPPSKQVNGHSFTICLMVWCSPQSQSGEAM